MSKVLVTGSGGTVGSVLQAHLNHEITPFDLPYNDAGDYGQLLEAAQGHDAIVHLAWDTLTDNYRSDHMNPKNNEMAYNVYRAAKEANVGRVVMASSVNADRFTGRKIDGLMSPYDLPHPNSPYGAEKVGMEAMGRYYADAKALGVVCLRLGDVNPSNTPAPAAPDLVRNVWLSHRDCANLVDAAVEAPLTDNYEIVYGISDNANRIHDNSNRIGWTPLDGAD